MLSINPRLDNGDTTLLPTFTVQAGVTTTLHITMTLQSVGVGGVALGDGYSFSLGGTLKLPPTSKSAQESLVSNSTVLGVQNSTTDALAFTLDTTNGWTTTTVGTKTYFYQGPNTWMGSPVTVTYDLTIDASTPADVYTMTARAAWSVDMYTDSQEFLINVVVPEPSSVAMLMGSCGMFAFRRRRK